MDLAFAIGRSVTRDDDSADESTRGIASGRGYRRGGVRSKRCPSGLPPLSLSSRSRRRVCRAPEQHHDQRGVHGVDADRRCARPRRGLALQVRRQEKIIPEQQARPRAASRPGPRPPYHAAIRVAEREEGERQAMVERAVDAVAHRERDSDRGDGHGVALEVGRVNGTWRQLRAGGPHDDTPRSESGTVRLYRSTIRTRGASAHSSW